MRKRPGSDRPPRPRWLGAAFALAAILLAACGSPHTWKRTAPIRQGATAAALAGTVAAGVVGAIKGRPDVPPTALCPPPPEPPASAECLVGKAQRHHADDACVYYCLDHCSYHMPKR
jgi:hypothetical protein